LHLLMIIMNLTAFGVYQLFGAFGPFHTLARGS